jgi:hypothetical protein
MPLDIISINYTPRIFCSYFISRPSAEVIRPQYFQGCTLKSTPATASAWTTTLRRVPRTGRRSLHEGMWGSKATIHQPKEHFKYPGYPQLANSPLISTAEASAIMALNTLTQLSNEIAANTKIVTDYLESKGLAAPSFDVNGLDEYPIPPTEEAPFKARLKLISLTKEMHDLALGPKEGLRLLAWDVRRSVLF